MIVNHYLLSRGRLLSNVCVSFWMCQITQWPAIFAVYYCALFFAMNCSRGLLLYNVCVAFWICSLTEWPAIFAVHYCVSFFAMNCSRGLLLSNMCMSLWICLLKLNDLQYLLLIIVNHCYLMFVWQQNLFNNFNDLHYLLFISVSHSFLWTIAEIFCCLMFACCFYFQPWICAHLDPCPSIANCFMDLNELFVLICWTFLCQYLHYYVNYHS